MWIWTRKATCHPTCTDIDLFPAEDQAPGVVVSLRTAEENILVRRVNKEMDPDSVECTHISTSGLCDASGAFDRLALGA